MVVGLLVRCLLIHWKFRGPLLKYGILFSFPMLGIRISNSHTLIHTPMSLIKCATVEGMLPFPISIIELRMGLLFDLGKFMVLRYLQRSFIYCMLLLLIKQCWFVLFKLVWCESCWPLGSVSLHNLCDDESIQLIVLLLKVHSGLQKEAQESGHSSLGSSVFWFSKIYPVFFFH